jgi:hypothetical protein
VGIIGEIGFQLTNVMIEHKQLSQEQMTKKI